MIYVMGREGGTGDGTAVSQRFDRKRDGVGALIEQSYLGLPIFGISPSPVLHYKTWLEQQQALSMPDFFRQFEPGSRAQGPFGMSFQEYLTSKRATPPIFTNLVG